jgi:hypothetical protein
VAATMSKGDKRTLYVGGLEEGVGVEQLRAAFIPFGEVGSHPISCHPRSQRGTGEPCAGFPQVSASHAWCARAALAQGSTCAPCVQPVTTALVEAVWMGVGADTAGG